MEAWVQCSSASGFSFFCTLHIFFNVLLVISLGIGSDWLDAWSSGVDFDGRCILRRKKRLSYKSVAGPLLLLDF